MQQKRKTPLRMCMGCGEMKPKPELVRIVRSPEGEVSLDRTLKPGQWRELTREEIAKLKCE